MYEYRVAFECFTFESTLVKCDVYAVQTSNAAKYLVRSVVIGLYSNNKCEMNAFVNTIEQHLIKT